MSEHPLPGHDLHGAEIHCPVCGAFVGALGHCPQCGARSQRRVGVRAYRWAAVFLATAGLGLLMLMAAHREIPTVRVADIRQTMNFAYVRVCGTVLADAQVYREGDRVASLRFSVDDGSGEIAVRAQKSRARQLVERDQVPRAGDRVEVAGSLNISAEDMSLWLQVPEHLTLSRAEVPRVPLGEAGAARTGQTVRVAGAVVAVAPPRPGSRAPWGVTVKDATGEGKIVFFDRTYREIAGPERLVEGAAVTARVKIDQFRDRLQLSLARGDDLQFGAPAPGPAAPPAPAPAAVSNAPVPAAAPPAAPAPAAKPPAPLRKVPELTLADTGGVFRVRGVLGAPRAQKGGMSFPLKADGAELSLVLWDRSVPPSARAGLKEGAEVTAEGTLKAYRGKLELVPAGPGWVRVEGAGGAP